MLKNKRRKVPYVIAGAILLSTAALTFIGIRGINQIQKQDYYPAGELNSSLGGSYVTYIPSEELPLSYRFSSVGYQIDIPQAAYQETESGIAAKLTDNSYIYIAEIEVAGSGISVAMDEFPGAAYEGYNRNSSYITPKVSETGYLSGFATEYTFSTVTVASSAGNTECYLAAYDLTLADAQKKLVIAGITTGSSDKAKDYIRDMVRKVAGTVRENPDFVPAEEGNIRNEKSPDYSMAGIVIEHLDEKKKNNGTLKEQYSQEPASEAEESTEAKEPSKGTQPESTPPPQSETPPPQSETPPPQSETPPPQSETPPPQSETPPPPAADPNDKSIKTFKAPLSDCDMSVTVTTGNYCADTEVTLTCPDGTVLTCASNGAGTYTFSTISQEGTYTVITTCFSAVKTVEINVHLS